MSASHVPVPRPSREARRAAVEFGVLVVCLIVFVSMVAGCSPRFYRRQADREVYGLVDCASADTRSPLNDYTIEPNPYSRFYDPYNPDCPPMPPDDPTSHELMRCVDGKRGWPYECWCGTTRQVENPLWMLSLIDRVGWLTRGDQRIRPVRDREVAIRLLPYVMSRAPSQQIPLLTLTDEAATKLLPYLREVSPGQERPVILLDQQAAASVLPCLGEQQTPPPLDEQAIRRLLPYLRDAAGRRGGPVIVLGQDAGVRLLPYLVAVEWERERPVIVLDEETGVRVARVHSRDYQRQLENLYLSALDVTFERFRFDVQFFGNNSSSFDKSGPLSGSAADSSTLSTATTVSAHRLLATGGQFAAEVANSVLWQFSGPDGYASITPVSLSLLQPLLRGAGRDVVLEDLTESERALLANVRQMERFHRGFFVQIVAGRNPGPGPSSGPLGLGTFAPGGGSGVGGYLSLLEQQLRLRNLRNNVAALRESLERIDLFYEYGRISRRQVDELLQNLYSSQIDLRQQTTGYYDQLDGYKITLGIPPQLNVEVQDSLLDPFDLIDPELTATQEGIADALTPVRNVWARAGSALEAVHAIGDSQEAVDAAGGVEAGARSAAAAAEAADAAAQAALAAQAGDEAKTAAQATEAARAAARAAQAAAQAVQVAAAKSQAAAQAADRAAQAAAAKPEVSAEDSQRAAAGAVAVSDTATAGNAARQAVTAAASAAQQAEQAAQAAAAGDVAKTLEAVQAAADAVGDAAQAAGRTLDRLGGTGLELRAAQATVEAAEAAALATTVAGEAVQLATEAVSAVQARDEIRIAEIVGRAGDPAVRASDAAVRLGKAAGSVAEAAAEAAARALQAAKAAQALADLVDQAAAIAQAGDHGQTTDAAVGVSKAAAEAAQAVQDQEYAKAARAGMTAALRAVDAAEAGTRAAQAAAKATAMAAEAAKAKVLESAPAALAEAVKTLWPSAGEAGSLPQAADQQIERVGADIQLLSSDKTLQTRVRHLQQLAQRPEFREGEVDPRVVDVDAFRRRVLRVNADFYGSRNPSVVDLAGRLLKTPDDQNWFKQLQQAEGLAQQVPKTVAALEEGFRDHSAEAARAADDDLQAWRDLLGRLEKLLSNLSTQLLELSLVQARARLDITTLTPVDLDPSTEQIDLDPEQALEIARANRRDWMNARAALVDRWRQVHVVARNLEADLDLTFNGSVTTRSGTTSSVQNTTGEIEVGLQFDAPLTRLVERNAYRSTLIDYQRARREYYAYEDQVAGVLRDAMRSVQLSQVQFELNRAAVHTAIDRVEQVRLELQRPPQPEEEEFTLGATTARDLVTALGSLLSQENSFLRVWLDYRIQQMNLDFDLGIMELDARGMWVPSPLVGGERSGDAVRPEGELFAPPGPAMELDLPPLEGIFPAASG